MRVSGVGGLASPWWPLEPVPPTGGGGGGATGAVCPGPNSAELVQILAVSDRKVRRTCIVVDCAV